MLFTDFRQNGEHGDRSKIVPTVLGAIFKGRCDARHLPFSWKTATERAKLVRSTITFFSLSLLFYLKDDVTNLIEDHAA